MYILTTRMLQILIIKIHFFFNILGVRYIPLQLVLVDVNISLSTYLIPPVLSIIILRTKSLAIFTYK